MQLNNSIRLHFHIVSTHPYIKAYFEDGVVGRAYKKNLFECTFYQLRDYCTTQYRSVDGKSYGGGAGQVLKLEPLLNCHDTIMNSIKSGEAFWRIFFSPGGTLWEQKYVHEWMTSNIPTEYPDGLKQPIKINLILFCGRYEGVDQRFLDHWIDFELSIGPYILSSGDLPLLVFLDSLVRFIPNTLKNPESLEQETTCNVTSQGFIAAPNFAPPQVFRGHQVPNELISGDPKKVSAFEQRWREQYRIKPIPKSLTIQVKS